MTKVLNNYSEQRLFFIIFFIFIILYTLFQTKSWTSVSGNIYGGDDKSYFAYINSLVNDFDFDFSDNDYVDFMLLSESFSKTGKIINPHPIGTSLLLLPFYAIAKPVVLLVDWIYKFPFDQKDPLFFLFLCSGIVIYLYLGGYFLYRALTLKFTHGIAIVSATLIVWGTILPVYAFRRPLLTHVPEFFLISLLLYAVCRINRESQIKLRHIVFLGMLNGLILITRFNNVHILLFSMWFLWTRKTHVTKTTITLKNKLSILTLFLIWAFLVFFFTQGMAWKYYFGSYFSSASFRILTVPHAFMIRGGILQDFLADIKFFVHIFIGLDWGLIFTMLPFAVGIISFLIFNPLRFSDTRFGKVLERFVYAAIILLPFIIIVRWREQGCFYGYRYLTSLFPFACFGLAFFLQNVNKRIKDKRVLERIGKIFLVVILLYNFLLILVYDFKPETTLQLVKTDTGNPSWVNDNYVPNALKFYFKSGPRELAGVFSRGFLGTYVFGAISLFAPSLLSKIGEKKLIEYYSLVSIKKMDVLLYPFVLVFLLLLTHLIIRRCTLSGYKNG